MLLLLRRVVAVLAAYPPRPRARAEVIPARFTYLLAKNAPGPLTTATRRSTHRGEISNEHHEA